MPTPSSHKAYCGRLNQHGKRSPFVAKGDHCEALIDPWAPVNNRGKGDVEAA